MDSSHLLTLIAGTLIGVTGAGLAIAWRSAVNRANQLQASADETAKQMAALLEELQNFRRARDNKLYRHDIRDLGRAAKQALLRVRVARAQLVEELDTIDLLLDKAPKD